ncbi:MAG TPA: hypothetical protein VLY04_09230 [Bryobacteraceae bacterium]|nr:hypothetical protein [Bryobacteraceae bacterium]
MTSELMGRVETDLRHAVEQRRYAEVERLVVSYCAAAVAQLKAFPAGDPKMLEIASHVDGLLEWTELMLRTARAAQADELRRIPFLRGYLGQVARKPARVSLDL